MIEGKFLTVREAAVRIGLSKSGVRDRLREGRLTGEKVSTIWLIPHPFQQTARRITRWVV